MKNDLRFSSIVDNGPAYKYSNNTEILISNILLITLNRIFVEY